MQSHNPIASVPTQPTASDPFSSPHLLTMRSLPKQSVEYLATLQAFKWAGLGLLAVAAACAVCPQPQGAAAAPVQAATQTSAKAYASAYTLNKPEGSIFSGPATTHLAVPLHLASQALAPANRLQ